MAVSESFDEFAAKMPVSDLERGLEVDHRRFRAMLDRYEQLRGELEDLVEDIHRRERLLEAYRDFAANASAGLGSQGSKMTKPQIVRRVLWASVEPLYPRQVRELAVSRGWLRDDSAAHNQLAVAMSKMARKGKLVKGEDGRYSLPAREGG